jgi:hypothetical protein
MTIGRTFPLQNPLRDFPIDPIVNGQTSRNAPLPFRSGAGASSDKEVLLVVKPLLTISVGAIEDPNNLPTGGGVTVNCNPVSNQYCVPRGTIVKTDPPIGTIRCSIT